MRLLHIITGLCTGGAEMMLLKLLERTSQRFDCHVVSLMSGGEVAERICALGIPIHFLGMTPGGLDLRKFFKLTRLIRRIQPDVVQTWLYHGDLLGGVAARLAGIKNVCWNIRNSDLSKSTSKKTTHAVVRLSALLSWYVPARILCCSVAARQLHEKIGYCANKILVIPNGFDLVRFVPDASARFAVRNHLKIGDDVPLVGLVGRFDPQKNHQGLIEAFGLLRQRLPSVQMLLVGKGLERENRVLMQWLDSAGVASATHLLGLRSDIPRLMAALDVFALSSSYGEAFPNVLGEAMSCGIPCVVTDVGDSAAIVGDTGRVVSPANMKSFAEAVEGLLLLSRAEKNKLSIRCRERIATQFEIGQVAGRYEQFYEGLYNETNAAKCFRR